MANSKVLEKFLEQGSFKLPRILPTSACMTENVTLKDALVKRSGETAVQQDVDVCYVFIDSNDKSFEKGRIEKFIWDLWTCNDLDSDQLNYNILESKMVNGTIPIKMSNSAVNILTYFLYNGQIQEGVNFTALMDLSREVSSLNLVKEVKVAVDVALEKATSLDNLRQAWRNGCFLEINRSTLLDHSVVYIICNPEMVFSGDDGWIDMSSDILQMLHPDILTDSLEKLEDCGATEERRETFSVNGRTYLKMSHFKLFYFLVEHAKLYYQTVANQLVDIISPVPSIYNLQNIMASSIDMIDATKFDVSKFSGDPAVKNGKTYAKYLNAYILLKNMIQYSDDDEEDQEHNHDALQHLDLPPPVIMSQELRPESTHNDSGVLDQNLMQNPVLAQTTSTVEKILKLFGASHLADKIVNALYSGSKLNFHSYVFGLRKSVFGELYNWNQGTGSILDLGSVTKKSAANFFKSFYLTKEELPTNVNVDLEYCFFALLFQVDFLLETVFNFAKRNPSCLESRVMHFVSAYRQYHGSTQHDYQLKLQEMNTVLQSDILNVVKTISFKFFFDEEMVYKLLGDYNAAEPGLYFELDHMSRIQKWLRKETNAEHESRLEIFKVLVGQVQYHV